MEVTFTVSLVRLYLNARIDSLGAAYNAAYVAAVKGGADLAGGEAHDVAAALIAQTLNKKRTITGAKFTPAAAKKVLAVIREHRAAQAAAAA